MFKKYQLLPTIILATGIGIAGPQAAVAQGSPLPGGAPFPGSSQSYTPANPASRSYDDSAPMPGARTIPTTSTGANIHGGALGTHVQRPGKPESLYHQLPISAEDARIRLEDLSNRLAVSRPDDVKDSIYALSEWLQDVADAHWRMYKAFEKSESTRSQANKEKEIALKFSALKNRAKLLKADLLIKQNRYPEALGPLVEIVAAEPTSQNGQDAYKRLVDMGFSEQVPGMELAEKASASPPAPRH